MAARRLISRRDVLPLVAGTLTATAIFLPKTAHADAPIRPSSTSTFSIPASKKPIYDDNTTTTTTTTSAPTAAAAPADSPITSTTDDSSDDTTRANPAEPTGFFATKPDPADPSSTASSAPTPTDRLTPYVRSARLGLYNAAATTESTVNNLMTRFLRLEHSFTTTVASLAPPKTANEPLVPGLVYVLVATMAGSIVSRNRGFLLRFGVPVAFGVGAGYVVLPVTMRNVGDLVWSYEERYPVVRNTHLRVRERVESFIETGKAHTVMGVHMAESKVDEAREAVQDWVKQGK